MSHTIILYYYQFCILLAPTIVNIFSILLVKEDYFSDTNYLAPSPGPRARSLGCQRSRVRATEATNYHVLPQFETITCEHYPSGQCQTLEFPPPQLKTLYEPLPCISALALKVGGTKRKMCKKWSSFLELPAVANS